MLVLAFPPRKGFKIYVNLLSRYGITSYLDPDFPDILSARLLITFPRTIRLLLILAPSANLSPYAPVLPARSEPAKSTKLMLLWRFLSHLSVALSKCFCENLIWTTVWALLLVAFMFVAPIVRFDVPCSTCLSISA